MYLLLNIAISYCLSPCLSQKTNFIACVVGIIAVSDEPHNTQDVFYVAYLSNCITGGFAFTYIPNALFREY